MPLRDYFYKQYLYKVRQEEEKIMINYFFLCKQLTFYLEALLIGLE